MTILITGSAGFVALNVIEALLGAGRDVVAFDRQPPPAKALAHFATLPGRLQVVEGDVRDAAALDAIFAATPIAAVLHAAAVTAGEDRERADPETILDVNIRGAACVFRAARKAGVARIVAPSSVAVYGVPPSGTPLLDEVTTPASPQGLYAISKQASELALLRMAALDPGVSIATPRLGMVYGPWEWATGVRDTLSPMLQSLALAGAGEEVLLNALATGDHVYATDVATGLVALLDTPGARGVFNIGSGTAATLGDWCNAVAPHLPGFRWRLAGPGETANTLTRQPKDRPPMALARMEAATGWRPRFGLAAGAAALVAWRAANP
ncbi:UDP-glucose 4-epimerase [Humitalea rosea]|uniref:UDP-glucose 4-epimerase n=1 Tax=Humitalea rosea TaxID=990373 RepID=A0A2W7J2A1_9PROT|nr:NAD(P)-dependent oxidoreductase [Humitalea rosea]PZW45107.1 UDP-glucose 4-epimerase [Humitalea rosea]